MELLVGGIGFLLFFFYDWNRVFWKKKWMSVFFMVGCLCQIFAGVNFVICAWRERSDLWILFQLMAILSLIGLIYTLFFALPFESTYCHEAGKNKVCRAGIYGLCRHPGIWWFFFCFLFLGMACEEKKVLLYGMILSALNLLYAWYQDRWIFPEEFLDYQEYQNEVPFLFPAKLKKGR